MCSLDSTIIAEIFVEESSCTPVSGNVDACLLRASIKAAHTYACLRVETLYAEVYIVLHWLPVTQLSHPLHDALVILLTHS